MKQPSEFTVDEMREAIDAAWGDFDPGPNGFSSNRRYVRP